MVQEYRVEIEETLCRSFVIQAESALQAIQKIKERYYAEAIVLNADDCVDVIFSADIKEKLSIK